MGSAIVVDVPNYLIQISDDVQVCGPGSSLHGFGCGEEFWGSSSNSAPKLCSGCESQYKAFIQENGLCKCGRDFYWGGFTTEEANWIHEIVISQFQQEFGKDFDKGPVDVIMSFTKVMEYKQINRSKNH